MKEVTIKIPEWAQGKTLYIFAGIELLARVEKEIPSGKIVLETVKVPCNRCGKCCMNIPKHSWYDQKGYRDPMTGRCKYLKKYGNEYECILYDRAPFECRKADPSDENYCCIEFERTELNSD